MLIYVCSCCYHPEVLSGREYAENSESIKFVASHRKDDNPGYFIVEAGDYLDDLMILCRADITSGNPERAERHLENFARVEKRIRDVREKDKLRAFKSPVNGNEIMKICGLKPGPKVGLLKKMIENAILNGDIANEYNEAFEYLIKIKVEVLKE